MDIASEDVGALRVLTVNEPRIDAAVAVEFKERMAQETQSVPGDVILDLSGVEFIDSSGLGAVVAAMKQLAPDHRLDLAGMTPTVDKVFRLTRMDSVFRIHPDRDAALAEPRDAA